MIMFKRGLKENIKDELMRLESPPKTLRELINAAITIDDKLYERVIERKYDNKVRSINANKLRDDYRRNQFRPRKARYLDEMD